MIRAIVIGIIALILPSQISTEPKPLPEAVVHRQVDAYNAHDIEAFVKCYSACAQTIDFATGEVYDRGLQEIRMAYGELFTRYPKLKCEIKARIVQGDHVIDQEVLTGKTERNEYGTAIYQVKEGLIVKVWFL